MTKDELLKNIAEMGYNVGFGAKKHFATYDIVEKTPGIISGISMVFGIYALVFDCLSAKFLSASFIVLGIVGLYIVMYDSKKDDYEISGRELTKLYNELGKLYRHTKDTEDSMLPEHEKVLIDIENRYYGCCKSKQILFSDWYAHYKFFWQHQIDWVDEQKKFRFFRDKIPLTAYVMFVFLVSVLILSRFLCCY